MRKPRLMLIGLDSVSLSLLETYRKHCPTIMRFRREAASGSALPCFPVYTPTNWAALASGADPATTLAAGWARRVGATQRSTFDGRALPCDRIFDSASRVGLKSLALCYPTAYPTRHPSQTALAPLDRGLVSNSLAHGRILPVEWRNNAFAFTLVERQTSASAAALAKKAGATEDGADTAERKRESETRETQTWIFRKGPQRFTLGLSSDPDGASVELCPEEWSAPIPVRIHSPGRSGKCVARVMVFDRGRRLAISEAYDIGLLGMPAKTARDIYRRLGPPTEHSCLFGHMTRLFDEGKEDPIITRLAHKDLEAQARWVVDAATYVQQHEGFDVFYLHHHYPDSVLHAFLNASEGSKAYSKRQQKFARMAVARCLAICDDLVAKLLHLAGPQTTVLLVSDHGVVTNRYACNVTARLAETGLLAHRADGSIDHPKSAAWPSTKAGTIVGTWIDVNAKEDTKRYEQLQARVIDALLDWKTDTGERVIALALRRKDAHLLGYSDHHCGDVAFHFNSGFAWGGRRHQPIAPDHRNSNHGPQMPVTFCNTSDNMAFYMLRGPHVKRGYRRNNSLRGYIRIEDIVPTICVASGVSAPADATGCVRNDLLKPTRGTRPAP